jgi:ssDNA-binding Zn-finger/Zn-ribbon topoisomerase 1
MFLLKGCPKCGGDIRLERDEYGDVDLVCLQCSYTLKGPERAEAIARLRQSRQVSRPVSRPAAAA